MPFCVNVPTNSSYICVARLLSSPANFHGNRDRRLSFFVDESQRFEGGFYDAGNEFRLLLDQLICGCHRSPGVLHFVTDENQFSKTAGSAGIAFTRRRNDGINGACHKGSNGVSCPSRVDERKVPVNVKTVFGQYLRSYDRGRGSDTADSNTFPFKVLQALQLRLAKNPTEDFIVCGKDDLKGRPSLGNADKAPWSPPRHTELKATRNHGLDTQF